MNLQKRLYFLPPAVAAAVLHNVLHESIHYLTATLVDEAVSEFRLFTNGWGISQVVFATSIAERIGARWLFIAWSPAAATVLIGYLLYANRARWLSWRPSLNAAFWYGG